MIPRILIIDDDAATVLLLNSFLGGMECDVRAVTDSRLAEKAFDEFQPDLVLLDLQMGEPNGLEVLRRLRNARENRFVPVIVFTDDTSRIARHSALVLGADDFLTKPLDRIEVMLRIRHMLRLRQLFYDEGG